MQFDQHLYTQKDKLVNEVIVTMPPCTAVNIISSLSIACCHGYWNRHEFVISLLYNNTNNNTLQRDLLLLYYGIDISAMAHE